jgi:hypothetical protein
MSGEPALYLRLVAPAVVVPTNPLWGAQVLGTHTVVALVLPQVPSPVTGNVHEPYVRWLDSTKTEQTGWLAEYTLRTDAKYQHLLRATFHHNEGLSAWDHLRSRMVGLQRLTPLRIRPLARQWLVQYGATCRAEIISTLRQFGDTKLLASTCSTDELTCRALALILHRRYTMKTHTDDTIQLDLTETEPTTKVKKTKKMKKGAKKSTTKGATKKTARKTSTPSANNGSTRITSPAQVGEHTLALLKKAGIDEGMREAGLLAKGKALGVTSLTTLRASINEAKAKQHAKGNDDAAAALNKMVRKVRTLLFDARAAGNGKKKSKKASK